jgi:hypothetical protein
MHTLLWALESANLRDLDGHGEIECQFVQPVSVGEEVHLHCDINEGPGRFAVMQGGRLCTQIRLTPKARSPVGQSFTLASAGTASPPESATTPMSVPPEQWIGSRNSVLLAEGDVESAFPRVCSALGVATVRSLARLSYIVGMLCPGQHSIFSSFRVALRTASGAGEGRLHFEVRRYDPRFSLVVIDVEGAIAGEVRAFVRPHPQQQSPTRDLLTRVQSREFDGLRALIIGGSRGLGELTAKLLSAGMGKVLLTYAKGRQDAERTIMDIDSATVGRAEAIEFRLGEHGWADLLARCGQLDAVFYFPTPKIFRRSSGAFDRSMFDEFLDYYVTEFAALCNALEARASVPSVRVFMPSSTAISERPRGMTEYTMAKAAAEVLAEDLGRLLRHVDVVQERLPRLSTDQTSTVLPVKSESNVDVLLPLVRRVLAPHGRER